MARTTYTDAQKAEAVALGREVGKAEASRRLGINAGTIGSWMSHGHVATKAGVNARAATEVRMAQWHERRARLVHEIGAAAEKALERVNEELDTGKLRDAKDAATTMAILVDKAQVLSGGATVRYGSDSERARVLAEAHATGLTLVPDAA